MVAKYVIGVISAFISGFLYFLLPFGFVCSPSLLHQFEDLKHLNDFETKIVIVCISLFIGSLGGFVLCLDYINLMVSFLISVVLLITKGTIKRFAIFSGGTMRTCINMI